MNTPLQKIGFTLLLSAVAAFADESVTVKHTLTLDGAKKAADAAIAYAKANGAPGSAIAVVDDGGHLLYFVRLDGTFTASPKISNENSLCRSARNRRDKDRPKMIWSEQ